MAEKSVKDFYESFPYPSKHIPSRESLLKNCIWLTKIIGKTPRDFKEGEKILEAGCGTGEFSCGFALGKAKVLGIDISENSLRHAKKLAKRFDLENAGFAQMDLINNPLQKESFDYIFCMGVLHHNKNPKEAFSKLVTLLKPKGFIVIGLYNKYGRIPIAIRRLILSLLAGKDVEKRILLANRLFYSNKPLTKEKRIWFADKYCHPLEKSISFGEVLLWFRENNIGFINSKPEFSPSFPRNLSFKGRIRLFLAQLSWMLSGTSFFTVAGRKK